MVDNVRFASQLNKALRAFEPLPGSTPSLTNQSETVRDYSTSCSRAFQLNTQPYNHPSQSSKAISQGHVKSLEDYKQSGKQFNHSEMEKYRFRESGDERTYGTSCNRALKLNIQPFYQPNNFVKSKDNANGNQSSGIETKALMHENNQRNHKVESNFTRGTSRSETCNCPSCTSCNRAFKHTTQSYSYSNSFIDTQLIFA